MRDPKLIKETTAAAIRGFPPKIIETVQNADLGSLHLASRKYRAPWNLLGSFRKGTMVVAGDAVHSISPFLGPGGSAALMDAVVLVRCLARAMTLGFRSECKDVQVMNEVGKAFDKFVKKRRLRVLRLPVQTHLSEWSIGSDSVVKKFAFGVVLKSFFGLSLGHAKYDCGSL